MVITDQIRQKGFEAHQVEKTVTVKSKWHCSVSADFSTSNTKFTYRFGKIDRTKSIIFSFFLFSLAIFISLDSPFLPLYAFLFVLSIIYDVVRFKNTLEMQKLIEGLVAKS